MIREGKKIQKEKTKQKPTPTVNMLPVEKLWRAFPVQRTHISTIYFRTWNLSSKIIYYKNVYKIAAHCEKHYS